MDDNTRYYKAPPRLIYELMQDTFGPEKFTYFLGSPQMIARDAYPILVVQSVASNNTNNNAATGQDYVTEQINIHVIYNDTDAAYTNGSEDACIQRLYEEIQGRDPATGFYMTDTAMYALRKNIDLGTAILNHDIDINYDVTRQPDQITLVEAIITVTTQERVNVPDRV